MAGFDQAMLVAAAQRGFAAAYRILNDRAEAEEACQEAVARAWAARDRYDPARPFYAWYHRILKNLCLDRLASRKHHAANPEKAMAMATSDATQEASMLASEDERRVHAAIESLPDDLREVIELRHFADASYAEMADLLEIPIGTVMSRLYRARKTLKEALS